MTTFDLHQHLWPAPFVAALRERSRPPQLVGDELVTAEGAFRLGVVPQQAGAGASKPVPVTKPAAQKRLLLTALPAAADAGSHTGGRGGGGMRDRAPQLRSELKV